MKTNISIELNDEQRLNLGQKYHNSKAKKMGIEELAKAIAKMTWEVSSER